MEHRLDVRGLRCPVPYVRAKALVPTLARGDVLVVCATDPEAPVDLGALAADEGLEPEAALIAPRVHWEDGVVYVEPGIEAAEVPGEVVRFRALNLFFGGAQCVARGADGTLRGGGDPRRGGVAVSV